MENGNKNRLAVNNRRLTLILHFLGAPGGLWMLENTVVKLEAREERINEAGKYLLNKYCASQWHML